MRINHASGYIEEKNGNKYLIFDSVDENKEVLKNTQMFGMEWDWYEIKTINGGKKNNYEKDDMKIRFNSDDDLPLNKPLKFHLMTIIIRSVFKEDGKLYPQLFLDDPLYDLVSKSYSTKKLMLQKELTLKKQVCQKNVCFASSGFLKMLDLISKSMFVIDVMIYLRWLIR